MKLFAVFFVVATAAAQRAYLPPGGGGASFNSLKTNAEFGTSRVSGSDSAYSRPAAGQIGIIRLNNDNAGAEGYSFDFETENRISQQETGSFKNAGTDNEALDVKGQFSYTGNDGVVYTLNYVADENGFRAQGDHLPVAPPIPEEILKSIELNAANGDDSDDGQYREEQYQNRRVSQQVQAPKSNVNQQSGYRY